MTAPKTGPSRGSIFAASFIGTSIEWYDYYIFGTAAALVFGSLFYPEFSPVAGTLAAFGTFAVGFFARPLGAAGHDRRLVPGGAERRQQRAPDRARAARYEDPHGRASSSESRPPSIR